jgi:hypothetical protein
MEHGSTNMVSCAAHNLCALVSLRAIAWLVRDASVMLHSSCAAIVPQFFFVTPCVFYYRHQSSAFGDSYMRYRTASGSIGESIATSVW